MQDIKTQFRLSAKKTKVLMAVLEHRTLGDAAASLGVDESTVWRTIRSPDFSAALAFALREMIVLAIAKLQRVTPKATQVFEDAIDDPQVSWPCKINSAKLIWEGATKGYELLCLESRLAALEAKVDGRTT